MSQAQMTVRVPDPVKVLWKEMADSEGRSMSNYLERLLLREKNRLEQGEVTLESLLSVLHDVRDLVVENKKKE